jgi:fructose-1,6-bisphosphatase/inositol monophosphatase family enzyme
MTDKLDHAVHIAMREAAMRAILPRFRALAAHEIETKAADDFVTIADHESEVMLGTALASLLPEAEIVGEEAVHGDPALLESLGGPLCWIIDPLDGTNNFAAGHGPFGIIVALAQGGETIGGWLLDPLSGRFCHARQNCGAWIDGERVHARASTQQPPIAAISLIFMEPEQREAVRRDIAPHYRLVDIPRCAAEQYPRLVLGQNDVSIFQRTLPWDHAAGVLFLNEAGGRAARLDGSPYRVNDHARPGLIGASTPALWDALAARITTI